MRGDAGYFAALEKALAGLAGVERVRTRPGTGSVLLFHRSDPAGIATFAEDGGLFLLRGNGEGRPPLRTAIQSAFRALDRRTRQATRGEIDVPTIAFCILVGLSLYQIARGNFVAPAWYTSLWYGVSIFQRSSEQSVHHAEGENDHG